MSGKKVKGSVVVVGYEGKEVQHFIAKSNPK